MNCIAYICNANSKIISNICPNCHRFLIPFFCKHVKLIWIFSMQFFCSVPYCMLSNKAFKAANMPASSFFSVEIDNHMPKLARAVLSMKYFAINYNSTANSCSHCEAGHNFFSFSGSKHCFPEHKAVCIIVNLYWQPEFLLQNLLEVDICQREIWRVKYLSLGNVKRARASNSDAFAIFSENGIY